MTVKNLTITIDEEDEQLLNLLCNIFKKKKTEIIRESLKIYYFLYVQKRATVR